MSDIERARKALVARILEGDGKASRAQRRAAFDDSGLTGPVGILAGKVSKRVHELTNEDVAAARASIVDENVIFEIAVCAAVGEASRQLESALAALRAASGKD
jgi:hypothetical protein